MRKNTRKSSPRKDFGMNTDSLMTWWLMLSNPMEAMCGLARTTMEMSNLILWLKVMALSG